MEVRITGLKECLRKLNEYPVKLQNKAGRKALREGQKIIVKAEKAAIPVDTGKLKKSLIIKAGRRKKGELRVKSMFDSRDFEDNKFYGGYLNYRTKIKNPNYGWQDAAVDSADDQALRVIKNTLESEIKKLDSSNN